MSEAMDSTKAQKCGERADHIIIVGSTAYPNESVKIAAAGLCTSRA